MECKIKWAGEGVSFVAETGSNHQITMDGAQDAGGNNLGPRPMELLLAGTGGCTAFDVVHILRKGRHEVKACEVDVIAERAAADPKVFTSIHFHFRVAGRNLKEETVRRAIDLSKEKYCSASIMLGKTADISYTLELLDT